MRPAPAPASCSSSPRRLLSVVTVCSLLASLSACDDGATPPSGETDPATEDDGDSGETSGDQPTSGMSAAGGPVIVALELRDDALDRETPVTELVAQVGHSDDLDELVGGLVRRDGKLLGAMLQVSEGTYSFGMTRELLDPDEPSAGTLVELEVEFTDRDGLAVSQTLTIPVCHGTTSRCGDSCRDLVYDEDNCGVCGYVCTSGKDCVNGDCRYNYDYYADTPETGEGLTLSDREHGEPALHLPIPSADPDDAAPLDVAAFNLGRSPRSR